MLLHNRIVKINYKRLLSYFLIGTPCLVFIYLSICCFFLIPYQDKKEFEAPPVEISYVEPGNFPLPDKLAVTDYSGPEIYSVFPKTGESVEIFEDKTFKEIKYAIIESGGNSICYIAKKSYPSPDYVMYKNKNDSIELFKAPLIYTCSISPSLKKVALIAVIKKEPHRNTAFLKTQCILIDIDSKEALFSHEADFDLRSRPIFLANGSLILTDKTAIVEYDFKTKESKTIIKGAYINPVLWKNEYLIFKKENTHEVYISNLEGKDIKLLYKNQFALEPLEISPDQKYLACAARYYGGDQGYIAPVYDLAPGVSLFVMDLKTRNFTYFFQKLHDVKIPHGHYKLFFLWYIGEKESVH